MAEFDKDYWERHWDPPAPTGERQVAVNPYVMTETAHLRAGTALDAGCGIGTEALWLSGQGWQVTGADISRSALAYARARAVGVPANRRINWIEADLSRWEPEQRWDLVVTNYAHAEMGQLALYQRIASWVTPGGTLLIVSHLHRQHGHDHPEGATATLETITSLLPTPTWRIEAAYENTRMVYPNRSPVQLHDVIVRARQIE